MIASKEEAAARQRSRLSAALGKIVWELDQGVIPPGDRAALRRGGLSPAFWRIAVRHLEPAGLLPEPSAPWRRDAEDRWALVLGGIAKTPGLHRPGWRFGRSVAQAGVSEARLLRLLQASGDALHTTLRSVIHQLASVGQPLDWEEPAMLVLYQERRTGEIVRRKIARDYYRADLAQRP